MTLHTLACLDGSLLTNTVCSYAAWSSERLGNSLLLLNVLDDVRMPTEIDLSGNIGVDARQNLLLELAEIEEKRAKLARQQGIMVLDAAERHIKEKFNAAEILTQQHHGDLVDSLIAVQENTRLFVIGRQGQHGEGAGQHIGHQVERVIRGVNKPVWVVTGEFKVPQKIMLAFDGSNTARKATEMVAESPLFEGCQLDVVMVGAKNDDNLSELKWAEERLTTGGFEVNAELIQGGVEASLLNYASENRVDTIVMGAYGHSKIREFFVGSHTNRLLLSAKIPLLLLR